MRNLRGILSRLLPAVLATCLVAVAPASGSSGGAAGGNCAVTSVGSTPLTDLGTGTYQGEPGGLYPAGRNNPPRRHLTSGLSAATAIGPLTPDGLPDANGKYAFVSIGMSNTSLEFERFRQMAVTDGDADPDLVIVNGAQGGADAQVWADPQNSVWTTLDGRLVTAGVTPEQVAVAWIKLAVRFPTGEFLQSAQTFQSQLEEVVRHLHDRFPNLRLAYLSSRIYGGYAVDSLSPEPYAYEGGFAVKWLLADQLRGVPELNFEATRGEVESPWLAWGPYLWADGTKPRSDGLTWNCSDFQSDGTHPSASGNEKVAQMLLDFFESDSTAQEWFLDR